MLLNHLETLFCFPSFLELFSGVPLVIFRGGVTLTASNSTGVEVISVSPYSVFGVVSFVVGCSCLITFVFESFS